MKQIQVTVPPDKAELVENLFSSLKLNYIKTVQESHNTFLVNAANNETSPILEQLKGIGVGKVFGTISMMPIELEITSERKQKLETSGSISVDEMISNIKGLALISPTFIILLVLAGFLAAFGLIYDNVVIIIASMIIAPLLGPIALAVLGTMIPKNPYTKRALLAETVGLAICITIGALVGLMFPIDTIEEGSQIAIRTAPGIGDIVFAIASGLAAGIFIIRGESTNIVGVAVAASLAPPATNVGVLLANAFWHQAMGSLVLLILNVIAIYSSCALIFWSTQSFVKGGTASTREYRKMTRSYIVQISLALLILIGIILLIITVFQ